MKSIILSLLLVFSASSIHAVAAIENHVGTIKRIYPLASGAVFFKLEQTAGCTPLHTNHYYTISTTLGAHDEYYAMLLAAAHSGKSVFVNVDNTACNDSSQSSTPVRYIFQDF